MTATTGEAVSTRFDWRRWLRRHGWTLAVWILLIAMIAWYATLIPKFGAFQVTSIIKNSLPLVFLAVVASVLRLRAEIGRGLTRAARELGAELVPASWFLFPRLRLERDGVELFLTSLPASKDRRACTVAWTVLEDDPDWSFDLRRAPARVGALERLGRTPARTGHGEFDGSFWAWSTDEMLNFDCCR